MKETNTYEVIIIGGSYAGLAAAMTLGRALRNVLVIDSGTPCNRQTPHSHNFLTQDGKPPAEINALAKSQVETYSTVSFLDATATQVRGINNAFTVETDSGQVLRGRKLIFATGLRDLMPEITGLAACWGISVIHCPYCHGYEVRGKRTGILVNGEGALEFVKLILNWTPHLTLFTNGAPQFEVEDIEQLGVSVVPTPLQELVHTEGYLKRIEFADGNTQELDALYFRAPFEQQSDSPANLGCDFTEHGHIEVNEFQQTSVEGIYAAGDCTTMFRSVSGAVAAGGAAGAMLNHELIDELYA